MQHHRQHIIQLIEKAEQGIATAAEHAELDAFYESFEHKPDYTSTLSGDDRIRYRERLYTRIGQRIRPDKVKRIRLPYWAAAAFAVGLGVAAFYFTRSPRIGGQAEQAQLAPIVPGGNRATLTLADGRTISLSEAQAGIVIGEGITYLDGSEVPEAGSRPSRQAGREDGSSGTEKGSPTTDYYVLSTPKGGTYQITLPDGSKVWLNAGSTLKYPSRFSGDSREVFLEGEAYFDISHQLSAIGNQPIADRRQPTNGQGSREPAFTRSQKIPFRVTTNGQTVEVLGTQFNISAYPDESETKTTLVEGAVQIVNLVAKTVSQLRPGQEASTHGVKTTVVQVDPQSATAWKDGYFMFDNEPILSILRKMGRWYDVDIHYEDDVHDLSFLGIIPRSEHIGMVLARLEKTGDVKFSIQGRRVSVMR